MYFILQEKKNNRKAVRISVSRKILPTASNISTGGELRGSPLLLSALETETGGEGHQASIGYGPYGENTL